MNLYLSGRERRILVLINKTFIFKIFISEKSKLKKYKLSTQKHKCDESRSASEYECRMGVGVRCDSFSATEENKAFEVHCVRGEKRESRKHRHDYYSNDIFEETKNETLNYCKNEYTSERSKQKTNKENSYDYTVEERKRKTRSEKHICSESEIISEAKDHSDPGPRKKKKRKEKWNCKDNENMSNSEERDKQEL